MNSQDQLIGRLPVLVLHVNNRCNCRCTMCSIWKSTDGAELTPETLRRYLPDIRALHVENVVLTGGEPLMNSCITELCAILHDAGVRITVLTTGLLLPRFADTLVSLTDEVIVSLDGPPEVHNRIRRVADAFDLLSAGVKAIRGADPEYSVSGRCTVQKLNCSALRRTVDAARAMGLRSISFLAADLASTAFNRTSILTVAEAEPLALTRTDILDLEQEIAELVREHAADFADGFIAESPEKLSKIPHHFRAHLGLVDPVAPSCNAPWVSAVIETDGTLRPCFFHAPIGKVNSAGLLVALNGPPAIEFRSSLQIAENPICRRCVCSLSRPIQRGAGWYPAGGW